MRLLPQTLFFPENCTYIKKILVTRYQNMKTCNSIWISCLFETDSETFLLRRRRHVDLPVFWRCWPGHRPRAHHLLSNSAFFTMWVFRSSPYSLCVSSMIHMSFGLSLKWQNEFSASGDFFPYHFLPPSTGISITLDRVHSVLITTHSESWNPYMKHSFA